MLKTVLALLAVVGGSIVVSAAFGQPEEMPQAPPAPRSPSSTISGCIPAPKPGSGTTIFGRIHFYSSGVRSGGELQVGGRSGDGFLMTKQAVIIKGPEPVVLRIPPRQQRSVQISAWGRNDAKFTASVVRIRLEEPCPNGQWAAYAGGFAFRDRHCLRLLVEVDGRRAVVPFGLGKPCATEHAEPPPRTVATCGEAALGDAAPQGRDDAAAAGPFGLFGTNRDFRSAYLARLPNGQFGAKLPAIVAGTEDVVVTVPRPFVNRVGLDFGNLKTAQRIEKANRKVTFEPCAGRKGTGWPGGLILEDRKPAQLKVQVEGESRTRVLTVGR